MQSYRWPTKFLPCLILLVALSIPSGCSDDEGGGGEDPGGLVLQMLGSPAVEKPSRVTLKFTVATADGKPVPGLKNSNFSISEDGKTLSPAESDHRIIPTPKGFEFFSVLLLDMSGSMIGDIPKLQQAANSFIDAVPTGLEVAIFTFDGRATLEKQLDFTTSKTAMKKAVTALSNYKVVDKSTNLYGAVLEGIKKLTARKAKAATGKETSGFMVLFTDGTDQASIKTAAEAKSAVDDARKGDLSFFSIGLGKEINKTELQNFGPDGFQFAGDSSKLNSAFQTIAAALKALSDRYYLLAYCSPKRAGSHKLTLLVTWNGKTGKLTATFSAAGFKGGCNPLGPDGGVADGSVGDGGGEAGLPDKGTDMKKKDGALPDLKTVDKAVPDKAVPDMAIIVSDKAVPDQAISDLAKPDLSTPDQNTSDVLPSTDMSTPKPTSWIQVTPGTFLMGSPASEPCRETVAGIKESQHPVTLTRPFEVADQEVTQDEYKKVMGTNPSSFTKCGPGCPVETVTWDMAAAYCNALSQKAQNKKCYSCTGSGSNTSCQVSPQFAGKGIYDCGGYRLPTEAEWEYMYRAGTTAALYNGAISASLCNTASTEPNAEKIGWYWGTSALTSTKPTKLKQKNPWGLYDLAGNVNEWCHDWFVSDLGTSKDSDPAGPSTGTEKVLRGGSWKNISKHMRAANRNKLSAAVAAPWLGFRCVRTQPWKVMSGPNSESYRAIWGTSDTDVFAVGTFGTIRHYDGKSWVKQVSGTGNHLIDVWGTGPKNVYAVGIMDVSQTPHKMTLLHYNGVKWSHVNTGLTAVNLHGIHGTATRIWAVGEANVVVHFNGTKWSMSYVGGTGWMRTVHALSNTNVWAGGDSANIYNFNGAKWSPIATGAPMPNIIYGLWGTSSKNMWAVGGNNQCMLRYDGAKWNAVVTKGTMRGIYGSGVNDNYSVGNGGTVRLHDGKTWTKEPVITNSNLYGVWVSPSGKVYAAGTLGVIVQKL